MCATVQDLVEAEHFLSSAVSSAAMQDGVSARQSEAPVSVSATVQHAGMRSSSRPLQAVQERGAWAEACCQPLPPTAQPASVSLSAVLISVTPSWRPSESH